MSSGISAQGLGSAVLELGVDDTKLNAGMDNAEQTTSQKMGSMGASATRAGAVMTAGLTVPIVAFGAAGVGVAADFQSQMNILMVSSGDANIPMETLADTALKIGADTELVGISASEAAEALDNFYKAGLTTNDMFGDLNGYLEDGDSLSGAMRAAIDLQAASELDLARASDVVSIAMKTYGLDADDAASIANNFVQTADASVASVSELADAQINAGPTMSAFGFGMEEVNGMLGMMSERGIRGAEAGTALKAMFNNMNRDTKTVTEALGDLNIKLYDQNGVMKSGAEIMDEFSTKLEVGSTITRTHAALSEGQTKRLQTLTKAREDAAKKIQMINDGTLMATKTDKQRAAAIASLNDKLALSAEEHGLLSSKIGETVTSTQIMTEETRAGYIADIAGSYGKNAMIALLDTGVGAMDEFAIKTEDAATAQESASARTTGYNAAMEQLGGVIETFQIVALTPLIEALVPLIAWFGDLIAKLADADPAFIQIGLVVAAVVAALGPLLIIVGSVISAVGVISGAIAAASASFALMSPAILAVLGPVVLIIAVIGGLIFLLTRTEKGSKLLKDTWTAVWTGIQKVVKAVLDAVIPFVQRMFAKMKKWVTDNMDLIQASVEAVLNAVYAVINWVLTAIQTVWETVWPYLQRYLEGIWNMIQIAVEGAINFVLGIIRTVMLMITGDWEGAWTEIKETLLGLWETMKLLVENAINTIWDIITMVVAAIQTWWEEHWDEIKAFLKAAWEDMLAKVDELVTAIETKIVEVVTAIETWWKTTWAAIKTFLRETWEGMRNKVVELVEAIRLRIKEKIEEIQRNWETWWGDIKKELVTKWTAMRDAVSEWMGKIKDKIVELATGVKNAVLKPFQDARDLLFGEPNGIWPKMKLSVSTFMTGLKTTIAGLANSVRDALLAPFQQVRDGLFGPAGDAGIFGGIITWIKNFISDVIGLFTGDDNGADGRPLQASSIMPLGVSSNGGIGSMSGGMLTPGGVNGTNYNITAVYHTMEDEVSLANTISTLQMIGA